MEKLLDILWGWGQRRDWIEQAKGNIESNIPGKGHSMWESKASKPFVMI